MNTHNSKQNPAIETEIRLDDLLPRASQTVSGGKTAVVFGAFQPGLNKGRLPYKPVLTK